MKEPVCVDSIYISCASNRTPHCLDWGKNNFICFGASHAVAIYDTKFAGGGKVLQTLYAHKDLVNAVCWVRHRDGSPETELVSASADRTVVVWTMGRMGYYAATSTLSGHQQSVLLVDAVYVPSKAGIPQLLVVTSSVDSSLRVWRRFDKEEVICTQTVDLDPGICLALRLNFLPGTDVPILAFGNDDAKISLFAESSVRLLGDAENINEHRASQNFVHVGFLIGHEDWVRALDFVIDDVGDLLLASAAQDNIIRLWRISSCQANRASEVGRMHILQTEEKKFCISVNNTDQLFSYSLESVLSGHDGWVYGISWCPRTGSAGGMEAKQPLQLLSSSMDKTMILWQVHSQSGVWLESVRLGEVGGNTLGFYGSKVSPNGCSVIAHGYQGSLHMWHKSEDGSSWQPGVVVGGHFKSVTDLCWEPGGQFLLSVSTDQTTRLHAPWVRADGMVTWHELARPQVHGYDMACLAMLSRHKFASGAEEKVIRVFQSPHNFLTNFQHICSLEDTAATYELAVPCGASVPALGLSNKAVYESEEVLAEDRHVKDEFPEAYFVPVELTEPPTEETLLQNTLWPEVQKLYGHGYELYALAARPDGALLASACRATTAEHAAILLWDTNSWQCVDKLISHQLTVTQLAFSPDGNQLLSVSRDRRWSLFHRLPSGNKYELVATLEKQSRVHTRIIWCCAWSLDSCHFATGSRDGIVAVWATSQGSVSLSGQPLRLANQSVTAIAFRQDTCDFMLAVGLDCGEILVYSWLPGGIWHEYVHLDNNVAHHLTVKRLAFRPGMGSTSDTKDRDAARSTFHLASCGCDNTVKIYSIPVLIQ